MSDPISALRQRETHGSVQVSDGGVHGMITLRGDLSSSKVRSLCKDLVGE